MIHSVLGNSPSSFEFICLAGETIPVRHKYFLEGLSHGRARFRYLEEIVLPEGVYVNPRYSAAAEYRLMLPELLPDYDKVLYLDCDMVVRNDLAVLFSGTDLGENLLGAVYERKGYFNSGFLLMNLSGMREDETSLKLMKALDTDYLEFPDQDALNMVCKGRVKALPPYCNGIRTFWLPQYKDEFLNIYSEDDYSDMVSKGNVHYTGGKPWNILTVRFGDWWTEYFSLPEEIRKVWKPSVRIMTLAKLYSCPFGEKCIDAMRTAYRKMRYRI
ncbi:MAG: glycosyltransferase family 8 protein [Bacteroidales bacterium]|nr:glycosyltransferase family 8 protein [Bacteroidales bacterium]